MNSLAISASSSFSLCNAYHQPSRLSFNFGSHRSIFEFCSLRLKVETRRTSLRCSKGSEDIGSGENKNRIVLDAFFLGKALAEVINERIESTIGDVLGNIGKFQAEQQKQVQEIQEEVLERAKRAKERAARETVEAQGGLVASKPEPPTNPKPAASVVASVTPGSSFGDDSSSSEEDSV